MDIYFLRHGESQANADYVFATPDSPLTEKGIAQAREAARTFHGTFDRIIASPLLRTRQTAAYFCAEHPEWPAVEFDERLAEYRVGTFAGRSREGVTAEMLVHAEGAEDVDEFAGRIFAVLDELKARPERRVLLISHAGVGHLILARERGMDLHDFYSLHEFPNATVMRLPVERPVATA